MTNSFQVIAPAPAGDAPDAEAAGAEASASGAAAPCHLPVVSRDDSIPELQQLAEHAPGAESPLPAAEMPLSPGSGMAQACQRSLNIVG